MIIQLNQEEVTNLVKQFLTSQGISLNDTVIINGVSDISIDLNTSSETKQKKKVKQNKEKEVEVVSDEQETTSPFNEPVLDTADEQDIKEETTDEFSLFK